VTQQMTGQAAEVVDELGPVDWIVGLFPGSRFKGEIAATLAGLADQGTIRILDLLLIRKSEDETPEFFEIDEVDESEIGQLRASQPVPTG
jgi:hypothetical protein